MQNVYVRLDFTFMNRDQGQGQVRQGQSINLSELNLKSRLIKGNQEIFGKYRAAKVLPEPINIF